MPQSKTPHLRFKGFSGEWEEKKLEDVSDVRDGTHASPKYIRDGHPFVTSKSVKDGKINFENIQYISDADFQEINKRSQVDINDILMGMIGTIGNIALIRENPNFAIKNVALIKDNKNVDYLYLYDYLQSPAILKQLDEGMDGGTQKFIALNKIRQLLIAIPVSKNEQSKIGDYFQRLDALIEQKEKKYQKLKQFKTAMLSQLFPKEGEHTPQLRFKGFSGEWEENKLKDIATFYNGRAYKQFELLKNGKYTVLRVGNFFTNDSWYYSDLELDDNKYCDDGDLLYAWSASFGPRIWKGGKVIYHYHIWKVENHEQVAKQFLFIVLDNETAKIKRKSTNGFALLHITKETIENWSIKLPSNIEEQTKIGNYFQKLDTLIDLHQQELEKLKTMKKALLAKMFV